MRFQKNPTGRELFDFKKAELEREIETGESPESVIDAWYTRYGTNEEGVKIVTPFSFSSSTQVLVDAIKFQIDQTNSLELARLANEAKLQEIEIEENYELQKVQAGFREREFLKKVSTVFFGVSKRDLHKELPEIR